MKTKIYYGPRLLGKFTCDGRKMTKFQRFVHKTGVLIKRTIVISGIVVVASWIATGSYWYAKANLKPVTVWAESIKEVPIKEIPPVLNRIAKCESPTGHFKDGKVVIKVNKNGSSDIGKYQINTVHLPLAAKLKLNVLEEKDNETMAMYLYENKGTDPWSASASCWR